MLQFATTLSGSVEAHLQQVSKALDAGCRWIRLRGVGGADKIDGIVDLCREADAILMIDNDVELVDKLRTHGVHLTEWDRGKVIAAREALGPHAVLGVDCSDAGRLNELRGLDVDYLVATPCEGDPMEYFIRFMDAFNAVKAELTDGAVANMTVHPVAGGRLPSELYASVLATGIEGVELSADDVGAAEVGVAVAEALANLQ